MSFTFTKLFSSITDSSIWSEDSDTKVVWITLLAMCDAKGEVMAAIPGLAKRSGVSLQKTQEALDKFKKPDSYSRTKDYEGRRIEDIDGGWRLLNYQMYREYRSDEDRKVYMAEYMKTYRKQSVNNRKQMLTNVNSCKPPLANAEEEAEEDKKIIHRAPSGRRAFTDLWMKEYMSHFDRSYLFQRAKDGMAAAELLRLPGATPEALMDIARKAWNNLSDFNCKHSVTIAGFKSQFNQIQAIVSPSTKKTDFSGWLSTP